MRLINWNICAFNKDIKKAIDSILSYNPDILCIQELQQGGLDYLKKFSDYNIIYSLDTEVRRKSKNTFLVILTKYKIINNGNYKYYQDKISSPFIICSKEIFGREKKHKSLYADIETTSEIKRIHNLHLSWPVGPEIRRKQFLHFLDAAKPNKSHLIFGDLNNFGKTINNVLAFIPFSYSLNEILVNEKKVFKDFFKKHGLQNPFEGTISSTWPWSFSGAQLDYILISKNVVIRDKYLLKETYGSDHKPQVLEIS